MKFIIYDECKEVTEEQWSGLEVKFGTIEDRIVMQMKSAIMDYVSDRLDDEVPSNKRKPYYRRGRWE